LPALKIHKHKINEISDVGDLIAEHQTASARVQASLRIRTRDPAPYFFDLWIRDWEKIWIRDKHPESCFRELRNNGNEIWMEKFGSGIRKKHPGSATLGTEFISVM
jgi:hypothetical protein